MTLVLPAGMLGVIGTILALDALDCPELSIGLPTPLLRSLSCSAVHEYTIIVE
jgi:hypothetical protein